MHWLMQLAIATSANGRTAVRIRGAGEDGVPTAR
jgi:hypothetical protein